MARKRKNFQTELSQLLDGIVQTIPSEAAQSLAAILQTNQLLSKLLSLIMSRERDAYLQVSDDSANGFYSRMIQSRFGLLCPSVPRTRTGRFRSKILPDPWVRQDEAVDKLVEDLLLAGMSKTKIRATLAAHGLSMPQDLIQELCSEIETEFRQAMSRELPEKTMVLIADAKQVEGVKENGTIGKYFVYQVYAIDWDANRDLYYFEVSEEPENAKKWISIFSKLVERGLREASLVISDDLPGITEAVKSIFKDTLHQLCVVHMKRNIFKHMNKQDAEEFCREFDLIKSLRRHDEARMKMIKLCERFAKKYPHLMEHMKERAAQYVQIVRFPVEVRKHLCSTNVVEGLNNLIEVIRRQCGGYFRSASHLTYTYAISYKRLKSTRWSRPHPIIKGRLREIAIIRNSIFQTQI